MAETHPIRGELAQRRMSIRAVAKAIGYSEDYVGKVFNGDRIATHEFRAACARLLEVNEDRLFLKQPIVRRDRHPGNRSIEAGEVL